MPELPEVEFACRRLRAWSQGRTVTAAEALPGNPLRETTADALSAGLLGRRITGVRRVGKQMFVDLHDAQVLLVHLGMTGKFVRCVPGDPVRSGRRFWIELDGTQRLDFVDPRRFGRVRLLPKAAAEAHPEITKLGPDAFELAHRPDRFAAALGKTRSAIKVALMDQRRMAGIGNIYAAEALFLAGIHPWTPTASLPTSARERLATGAAQTMRESLERETAEEIHYLQEVASKNPFLVYGRSGAPCLRCQTPIERAVQAGRGTFWCPKCQPTEVPEPQLSLLG
jgi:formamidopyrimidine-DNA glycosylase